MQDLMSSLISFERFTVFILVHNFSHFCSNSSDFFISCTHPCLLRRNEEPQTVPSSYSCVCVICRSNKHPWLSSVVFPFTQYELRCSYCSALSNKQYLPCSHGLKMTGKICLLVPCRMVLRHQNWLKPCMKVLSRHKKI